MADLNVVYAPVVEYENPDVIIGHKPRPISLPGDPGIPVYLPDEIKIVIMKQNTDSVETGNAVKVAYTGITPAERSVWLASTLQAINNRVQFIKERSNQILTRMSDTGSLAYDASLKIFTAAVAAVPVVGTAISYIVGKQDAQRAINDYKLQQLIKDYSADLGQLAQIRASLIKEYQSAGNIIPVQNPNIVDEAPKAIPTWYYYVGAFALLVVLLIILKNRRQNSR